MTTEPKLLTEAEARSMLLSLGNGWTVDDQVNHLRERGLIAEEPVDPLRDMADSFARDEGYAKGGPFSDKLFRLLEQAKALGMELAPRKELTREMVREALHEEAPISRAWSNAVIDSIRDKIVEALQ